MAGVTLVSLVRHEGGIRRRSAAVPPGAIGPTGHSRCSRELMATESTPAIIG